MSLTSQVPCEVPSFEHCYAISYIKYLCKAMADVDDPTPRACRRFMTPNSVLVCASVIAAVGSSRMKMRDRKERAFAISTICC